MIDVAHLVHTTDSAIRRAAFFSQEFALNICRGVLRERDAGVATLLRAIVHQAKLANVEISSARSTPPIVGLTVGYCFLKMIEARVTAARQLAYAIPDRALRFAQRLQLATAIVNNSDRRRKSQGQGPLAYRQRIRWIGQSRHLPPNWIFT